MITRSVTSPWRLAGSRRLHALRRTLSGRTPTVHYFHQFDDPYSQLAATQLGRLESRYRIRVEVHAVPPPEAAAAPAAEALRLWSARDAARWAQHFGLPCPEADHAPPGFAATEESLESGRRLRRRLGHYLGAMLHFEGEWYWGLDRLHYLETRLIEAGLNRDSHGPCLPPPMLRFPSIGSDMPAGRDPTTLDFFCSLRSPYTWLAVDRVRRLARHYGATLRLKFVLPMVMRGLPVPLDKRLYILADAKREALRLGLPFGDVADPVGQPVERGLALLHHAIGRGVGEEFLDSFLRGVFAEGIDAGSRRGLARLAARAGLGETDIATALADGSWRDAAARHREDLLATGLWGVPSFRVGDLPAVWGQDRLWMVEEDLIYLTRPTPQPPVSS
jgi:2-hydroxychromene-2-carboxylate isomerase